MKPNEITERIIGGAIRVHRELGPVLLKSAYEACLAYELADAGLKVERQNTLPAVYRDLRLDEGYRLDLLVEDTVIVELKAVSRLDDIHEAQLLSYLRLAQKLVALLINFHVSRLTDGVRRVVNGPHPLTPTS